MIAVPPVLMTPPAVGKTSRRPRFIVWIAERDVSYKGGP